MSKSTKPIILTTPTYKVCTQRRKEFSFNDKAEQGFITLIYILVIIPLYILFKVLSFPFYLLYNLGCNYNLIDRIGIL